MSGSPVLLAGPTVALVPVPVAGAPEQACAALGLSPVDGWLAPGALPPPDGARFLVRLDDEVIGTCGCEGAPDEDGALLLTGALASTARGRGLGTEALAVLATWAEQQPEVRLLAAQVPDGEPGAMRALARLGFVERGSHPPVLHMVRAAPGRLLPGLRGRHVC